MPMIPVFCNAAETTRTDQEVLVTFLFAHTSKGPDGSLRHEKIELARLAIRLEAVPKIILCLQQALSQTPNTPGSSPQTPSQ